METGRCGVLDVLSLVHPGALGAAQAGMGTQGRWWGQGKAASKGVSDQTKQLHREELQSNSCPGNLCSWEVLRTQLDKVEGGPAPAGVQGRPQACSVVLAHCEAGWGWSLLVLVLCNARCDNSMGWVSCSSPWERHQCCC